MKAASAKAKGRRLEAKVAKAMRDCGLDRYAKRMPLSGAVEWMKNDVYNTVGLNIECKNRERHNIWQEWNQVREYNNARLVISGNMKPILVVMSLDDWLELEMYKKDAR